MGRHSTLIVTMILALVAACPVLAAPRTEVWHPYPEAAVANETAEGWLKGQRMPDIAYVDSSGLPTSIARQRGSILFINFWASWCVPCLRENPSIAKLHKELAGTEVKFVMLQLYEPVAKSREWAERQGFGVPLADSGSNKPGERTSEGRRNGKTLVHSSGEPLDYVPVSVPHTYVVDRNGIIIAVYKTNYEWETYGKVFRDVIERSSKHVTM